MSISYSGAFRRPSNIFTAITKQLKLANLKPVKRIEVKFDPFHENAETARNFLFHINNPMVTNTNITCNIKANVVCDRSEPEIRVDLLDKGSIKFQADNLTVLEILTLFNKHISSKVVPEEPVSAQASKIEKKKLKQKR